MRLLRSSCLAIALITACLIVAAGTLSNSPTEIGLLAQLVYAEQPRALPQATPTYTFTAYLPLILLDPAPPTPTPTATATRTSTPTPTATPVCPTASGNQYSSGIAYQFDLDKPARWAWNHADKNIKLRGYAENTSAGLLRKLVNYGSDDPTQPPQFATLFAPARVPPLTGFYRVMNWTWADSPQPGTRGSALTTYPVTALGLQTSRGEALHVPTSNYDIGGGMEVIVLFADERTIALRYTREDTGGGDVGYNGYTVHLDNICTDPNLLALYNSLDSAGGPRYQFYGRYQHSYNLPAMEAGKVFGTARGSEVVVAVADTGSFMDTRSCNEWWQVRPGYTGSCPWHD